VRTARTVKLQAVRTARTVKLQAVRTVRAVLKICIFSQTKLFLACFTPVKYHYCCSKAALNLPIATTGTSEDSVTRSEASVT
jgi:hypothetical protein